MNLRNQGKIFTSDDHGRTWTYRADFPFWHARPFVAGPSVYVLGQDGRVVMTRYGFALPAEALPSRTP